MPFCASRYTYGWATTTAAAAGGPTKSTLMAVYGDVCTFKWFFPGCYTSYCALCYGIHIYHLHASSGDADIIIYNCEYGFNWSCAAQKNVFTSGFVLRCRMNLFFENEKWFLLCNCGPPLVKLFKRCCIDGICSDYDYYVKQSVTFR